MMLDMVVSAVGVLGVFVVTSASRIWCRQYVNVPM